MLTEKQKISKPAGLRPSAPSSAAWLRQRSWIAKRKSHVITGARLPVFCG